MSWCFAIGKEYDTMCEIPAQHASKRPGLCSHTVGPPFLLRSYFLIFSSKSPFLLPPFLLSPLPPFLPCMVRNFIRTHSSRILILNNNFNKNKSLLAFVCIYRSMEEEEETQKCTARVKTEIITLLKGKNQNDMSQTTCTDWLYLSGRFSNLPLSQPHCFTVSSLKSVWRPGDKLPLHS